MRGPIPSVFPPNPSSPHEHPTLVVSHHYENRPYLSVHAHIAISLVGAGFKPALAPNPSHCPRACGDPSHPSFPCKAHPHEPPTLVVAHHYENRPYLCSSRPHCNQSRRGGFQTRPRPKPLPLSSRMRGPIPSVFPPNPSSPHEHPTLVVAHHYENRPLHAHICRRGSNPPSSQPPPLVLAHAGTHPLRHSRPTPPLPMNTPPSL